MYLVAIAWMYVVVMMSVVEASSPNGTVVGAVATFLLYGALPLGIVLYILGTPARKRRRLRLDATPEEAAGAPSGDEPDRGDHPPGDAVAPERKEA